MGVPLDDATTYPGLLPVEVSIFKAWLRLHEKEYDRFDFNVRVGRGNDPGPSFSEADRRNAVMNSQKRIDAVGYKGDQATIIEVKDRAGASALGELLTYALLYWRDRHTEPGPFTLLVTNSLQADMDFVLLSVGVPYVLAPFV